MSTILVVGSTGMLGSDICERLHTAGKSVRALVRASSDPSKVSRLETLGIEIVEGDVRDRASLEKACEGVTGVISTVASMPFSYQRGVNDLQTTDLDGVTHLIEAAKDNYVSHFTYISISGNVNIDCPLQRTKREMERRLKGSGLVYTILRPSCFMESWLSPVVGFDVANAKVMIYGSGQNPISWISVQDVAQFAIASLEYPEAKNATLELGGPQALSPLQVVRLFEKGTGRSFDVQFVPEEALQAQQDAATDPMQQSFSALTRFVAMGDVIEMSATLQTFGIQPTTVEEYARYVLTPA